jgi:hypothetical protein
VAVILGKEKRIIRNNVLVGEGIGVAMAQLFKRSAIVGPGILRVAITIKGSLWTEVPGETSCTVVKTMGILLHARSIGVVWRTTWTMEHVLCDTVIELGMEDRIRELCMDNGINMVGVTNFVCRLEKDEEVDVGQATLLELNGVDTSSYFTKQTTFDIIQQGILLLVEDTCNNVRTI